MADLNKVFLIGRLTRKPELRHTKSGKAVAELGVAVNYGYGEKKETVFLAVEVWEKVAENACKYLDKGRQVFVEGRIKQSEYQDKNDQKQHKTTIVAFNVQFLDKPKVVAEQDDDDNHGEDRFGDCPF